MNHPSCPQCSAAGQGSRRARVVRRAMPLLAAGLVGAVLPLANHFDAQAQQVAQAKAPAFSGYSTDGEAEPMRIEVFEPTIPIPASPQAEIETGYTTTEADSSSSHGRASYVWPGDAVGEGFKTIVEALKLPLPEAVYANGYPVQVNSAYPAGPDADFSQPTPGMVMRTSATEHDTSAETAGSTDCKTSTEDPGDGNPTSGPGGLPSLPGLPGIPSIPGLPGLSGVLARSSATGAKADDGTECMTPTELDALVTSGDYQSVTRTHSDNKQVYTQARAALSDIKFAGGLVTLSGVSSSSKTASNGKKAMPTGKAHYGTLEVAGQVFTIGPNGVESPAGSSPIPGLPDAPAAALKELGFSFEVPKPVLEKDKAEGNTQVEALIVTIDASKLRNRLDSIPFDDITGMIPDQAGELKSALQAATHLASKFVIHLGYTQTETKTVQPLPPIKIPPPSTPTTSSSAPTSSSPAATSSAPASSPGPAPGGGGNPPNDNSVVPPLGDDSGPGEVAPGEVTPSTTPSTEVTADPPPLSAPLPDLFSIPGLLLYGGLAGGALAGAYVRRLGIAALGGTSACPHGLDSGLPDLRKA